MKLKWWAAWAVQVLLFFYLTVPILGQDNTINADDVNFFVRMANLEKGDGPAAAELFAQTDRNLASLKVVQEKIVVVAVLIQQNVADDLSQIVLADEGLSPAEFDIVKQRVNEVVEAMEKLQQKQ
jgi:hypothetical protein